MDRPGAAARWSALGIIFTGLPAALVLIGVASLGAAFASATGTVPLALLSALPGRLVNLFENDLLQALPLYVLMGLLLDRLPVAEALYRTGTARSCRAARRRRWSPAWARRAARADERLGRRERARACRAWSRRASPPTACRAATRDALVAVASTLGVVIPPSLVLILLGDAMLGAHTIAVTATGAQRSRHQHAGRLSRRAARRPGLFLVLCLIARLAGRPPAARRPARRASGRPRHRILLAMHHGRVPAGAARRRRDGYFYAVEAAAMGAFVLFTGGAGHRTPARRRAARAC